MESPSEPLEQNMKGDLDQLEEIPSLPTVIPRLLSTLNEPDSSAEDVGKVLQMDPGLTAKVFKLINSSYYGLRREINSIQEAVSYIGFDTIRNLALTTGVIEQFSKYLSQREGTIRLNWFKLWKYSIASGIAAETVGRHLEFSDHENAMASGILHRLGLVVLQSHFDEYMNEIVEQQRRSPGPLLAIEREILGVDEQQIGLWLTEQWDFPDSIASGIGYHDRPLEFPAESYADNIRKIPLLVNVGKNMAHKAGHSLQIERQEPVLNPKLLGELGIDQREMTALMDQFRENLDNASVFMEIIEELEE